MSDNHEEHLAAHSAMYDLVKESLIEVRHHQNYFLNIFCRLIKGPKLVKLDHMAKSYAKLLDVYTGGTMDALIPDCKNLKRKDGDSLNKVKEK